jgi:hypothetical protein
MAGRIEGRGRGLAGGVAPTKETAAREPLPAVQEPAKVTLPAFERVQAPTLKISGRLKALDPSTVKNDAGLGAEVALFRNPAVAQAQGATRKPKATEIGGMNAGALGAQDPAVPAARRQAKKVQSEKIDWKNPEKTLEQFTQFEAKAGNSDAVRCGAAVVVAGALLKGPTQFQGGLGAVAARASNVAAKYSDLSIAARAEAGRTTDPRQKARLIAYADQADEFAKAADAASEKLFAYADKNPKSLTQKDLQTITEAVYRAANVDQRLNGPRTFDNATDQQSQYLQSGAVKTYAELMWGSGDASLAGSTVKPSYVENGQGGGHFVLTQADGKVAYNPWPQADGTAFVRAKDGDGAKVGASASKDTLKGQTVDSLNISLPSRD